MKHYFSKNLLLLFMSVFCLPTFGQTTLINFGSSWSYYDNEDEPSDQGALDWNDVSFNDGTWSSGNAQLGYGDGDEVTATNSNAYTTYFRHSFNVTDPSVFADLNLNLTYDDGAIVYLNGLEVWRVNMSTGTVSYNTFTPTQGSDNAQISTSLTDALITGTNVISVEIHQRSATSSDISFDFELTADDITPPTGGDLIEAGSTWKYLDDGSNQGTAWTGTGFDDSSWASGDAELGYGNSPVTIVSYGSDANNKHRTTYFRKSITVADASAIGNLDLEAIRDDGMVVYLNGTEIWRDHMPTGSFDYLTFANTPAIGGADESTWITNTIANSLVTGTNVVAVEIHQVNATSSDLSFNFKMSDSGGTPPSSEEFITDSETWKYLDNGSDQGTSWYGTGFDDSSWASGSAMLGYGTITGGTISTTVGYGSDANNKYPTTYFRKTFNVTDPSAFDYLSLEAVRDDAMAVYINGSLVWSDNLPGTWDYQTYSTATIGSSDESAWISQSVLNSLVVGTNVVAVEIHQVNATSSDISFNFRLSGSTTGGSTANVDRGPYLQTGTPTSVIVKWRTDVPTESIVNFGTSLGSLTQSASDLLPKTEHEVEITGLTADTKYYYDIANNSGVIVSENSGMYVKTAPTIGTDQLVRAWILGDAGTANANQRAVRDAYYNYVATAPSSDQTDMMLFLGDNAYNSGTDNEYQYAVFENMYEDMLKKSVAWSTLGNHDGYSANSSAQTGPYYDIFSFPTAGESGGLASGTEAYYSYDYANIHFIVLDSYESDRSVGGDQYIWAQSDIQSTTQDWIVVVFHHPPYTKGSHNSDSTSGDEAFMGEMRANFMPMLELNGADLVLSGHSHSYERSYFLNGHHGLSGTFNSGTHTVGTNGDLSGKADTGDGAYTKAATDTEGAVYITAGSSGKISGGDLNHNAMFASINELGSCVLEVDSNTLNLKFLNSAGNVSDYFTIEKTGASQTWYEDDDGDTFGNSAVSQVSPTQPVGYVSDNTDCDDNEALAFPGNPEVLYDGIDNDCNPETLDTEDVDGDGENSDTDCDDSNPAVNSSATEILYNGIDDDCNPVTLDTEDADGDGENSDTDCDDSNPAVNSSATEILYNGIDDDCNPATLDTEDADGDGENSDTDCDDSNPAVNSSATEILYNGIDDDCNPATLDTEDADGDGENSDTDCDDSNPAVNSSATEILYNGIDDDCNPATLDTEDADGDGENSDTDCDDSNPAVNSSATEIEYNGIDDDCNPATLDEPIVVDNDGDGYSSGVDCNDNNPAVNPGATEIQYNGIDDDCNPETPDTVDADGDGVNSDTDCDDNEALAFPGNPEVLYDGIDNDCNPATLDTADADGDGENSDTDCDDSNPAVNSSATEIEYNGIDDDCNPATLDEPIVVDNDGDGYSSGVDCNDNNPAVNPGATEIQYNGIDDDCNPATPDTVDADGDGVNSDTDCDDNEALAFPGNPEVLYDGIDNDCNPATPDTVDADGDGENSDTDCDDSNPAVNSSATEIQYNGIDDDCNPATPDTVDADGDGENSDTDCDDSNPAVNSSVTEIQYNGIDDDCNPATPDTVDADGDGENSDTDCDDNNPAVNSSATEIQYNGIDDDCNPATPDTVDADGDGVNSDTDCDDNEALAFPGNPEVLYDGIDNDCNPATPDTVDADGDGENSNTDCDDSNPAVNSSATEIQYNGIDDDCNPATPDTVDADGDGENSDTDCDDSNPLVNSSATEIQYNGIDDDCNPATPDTVDADGDGENSDTDCDDSNPAVNSSATEIQYNGIDDDCNPATPDTVDADGDGENSDTDCDDSNPLVNSSATEIQYNGIDDDCNPATPDTVDADGDGENSDTDCDDSNPAVNSSATEILYNGIDDDCNPATPDTVDADGDGVNSDTDPDDNDGCVPNSNSPTCITCGDILFDGFETGFGNWNDGGSDATRRSQYPNSGNYSIRIRDNSGSSSSMYTDALDLTTYPQVSFQFSFYPQSMENNEDFFLEISTNGGSSYTNIQTWARGTHFNNNIRYDEDITINGPFSSNTVFRLRCDASGNADRIFIDDVLITSCIGQQTSKTVASKKTEEEVLVLEEPIQNEIKIYPNPASEKLFVECSTLNGKEATISLYNITGQLIHNVKLKGDYNHLQEINLNRLEEGLYILRMIDDKGSVLKIDRVIVSK